MAGIFASRALAYEVTIRARFGSTVCALVTQRARHRRASTSSRVAGGNWPGVRAIPIAEPTEFQTYIAYRKDATLSSYCEYFIAALRGHMEGLRRGAGRAARAAAVAGRRRKK